MRGGSLYVSLSSGWFSIKCHLLIKISLRLGTDGLYCVMVCTVLLCVPCKALIRFELFAFFFFFFEVPTFYL